MVRKSTRQKKPTSKAAGVAKPSKRNVVQARVIEINDLPDEVLAIIFSSCFEVSYAATQVCRRWCPLARQAMLDGDYEQIKEAISRIKRLQDEEGAYAKQIQATLTDALLLSVSEVKSVQYVSRRRYGGGEYHIFAPEAVEELIVTNGGISGLAKRIQEKEAKGILKEKRRLERTTEEEARRERERDRHSKRQRALAERLQKFEAESMIGPEERSRLLSLYHELGQNCRVGQTTNVEDFFSDNLMVPNVSVRTAVMVMKRLKVIQTVRLAEISRGLYQSDVLNARLRDLLLSDVGLHEKSTDGSLEKLTALLQEQQSALEARRAAFILARADTVDDFLARLAMLFGANASWTRGPAMLRQVYKFLQLPVREVCRLEDVLNVGDKVDALFQKMDKIARDDDDIKSWLLQILSASLSEENEIDWSRVENENHFALFCRKARRARFDACPPVAGTEVLHWREMLNLYQLMFPTGHTGFENLKIYFLSEECAPSITHAEVIAIRDRIAQIKAYHNLAGSTVFSTPLSPFYMKQIGLMIGLDAQSEEETEQAMKRTVDFCSRQQRASVFEEARREAQAVRVKTSSEMCEALTPLLGLNLKPFFEEHPAQTSTLSSYTMDGVLRMAGTIESLVEVVESVFTQPEDRESQAMLVKSLLNNRSLEYGLDLQKFEKNLREKLALFNSRKATSELLAAIWQGPSLVEDGRVTIHLSKLTKKQLNRLTHHLPSTVHQETFSDSEKMRRMTIEFDLKVVKAQTSFENVLLLQDAKIEINGKYACVVLQQECGKR